MRRFLSGIAALTAVMVVAGVLLGGFYLRSLRTPVRVGQSDASASRAQTPAASATPSDIPSPTEVASLVTPSPSPNPPPPAGRPTHPAPTCPPEVITRFTARAAPDAVLLAWTVSGGCGNESGWIQGSFALPDGSPDTRYPGLWVVPVQRPSTAYTDHPQKPGNSQGVCLFGLSYWIDFNGNAPDGRGVPAVNTTVSNVNLC